MTSNLVKEDPHGLDLISKLPNTLLSEIVSQLPTNEAVRTSILSRQWKSLWRYVSHLDFEAKRMMKPKKMNLYRLGIDNCLNRDVVKELFHAVMMIDKVFCKYGKLKKWIEFLVSEKRTQELAFTCDEFPFPQNFMGKFADLKLSLPSGIFSCTTLHALELTHYKLENDCPFDHCHNLRTLKLEWLSLTTETLDGIISSCASLEHLNLSFCSQFNQVWIAIENVKTVELEFLDMREIYLSTMSLGELCDYIMHSLNVVSINGFNGKERQLEFVRCLITKATVMKRMNICFIDSCSREGADATLELLLLPRSSINVSIVLKPGPEFVSSRNNANFETWISTLK
ncbi:F-box domain - like 10 [Theobroma cacao]|nr:F-box domain - like 10 [Theobroma cacao]